MTQNLAKYHARSPRYILNTQDDYLIRVAGPRQTPWEEGTIIQNVSLTGLAFTAPADLCPILGEIIKIQFHPPDIGKKQNRPLACYALVTRIDRVSDSSNMVAVHFYKMEMGHRIALAQGLSRKLRLVPKEQNTSKNENIITLKKIPMTLKFMIFTSFWVYCFYLYLLFQSFSSDLGKRLFNAYLVLIS